MITDNDQLQGIIGVSPPPLTPEILQKAIAELKAIPKNDQWLVVSPAGQVYKGMVTEVTLLLLKNHPHYKLPMFNETA